MRSFMAKPRPISHKAASFSSSQALTQNEDSVREITTLLNSHNWQALMESSDIPKKLNTDIIRSVILQNRWVTPNASSISSTGPNTKWEMGFLVEAVNVFLGPKNFEFRPSLLSCNSLLGDLLKGNKVELFWKVFDGMCAHKSTSGDGEKGCSPNLVTYNVIMGGLCRARLLDEAIELKRSMRSREAKLMLLEMINVGLKPEPITYNALIDGFMRQGDIEQAFRIKDEMVACGIEANLIIWNTLLNGVCKAGKMEKALEIMQEMMEKGVEPDSQTYSLLIEGHCRRGRTWLVLLNYWMR
ncbi:Pentatricopeptide repeat-containing protein [Vitis vinifera]|uniref:Pentatricopeptide repeat-containing protein n=1 Tax=Vitis vinifera TaxID=29760 RepID=A0A438JHC9_VITVI|nr:Pentatricopeptide repeat-containing protein [Vitis vinifera]